MIEKIKKPLMKAITILAMRYPEPTVAHTLIPNTHRLLGIQDKFLQHYVNTDRIKMFRAAMRILICEYEHDRHYREVFDWLIEEIEKSGWENNPRGHPQHGWKEDKK